MTVLLGDCRQVLRTIADNSVDAIVTDPPYELGFMAKSWDSTGVAYDITVWQECLRVLKPGGHLLAFGGSRTYHRLACAIEDAGFQIRDQIMWVYGSGFPKSLNIEKAINKIDGVAFIEKPASGVGFMNPQGAGGYNTTINQLEQVGDSTARAKQWEGWGTALKPAHEPIVLARKPFDGTVANNVLVHGTGGINIDGCRVGDEVLPEQNAGQAQIGTFERTNMVTPERTGRFPANFIHDGSDEVLELFPETKGEIGRVGRKSAGNYNATNYRVGVVTKEGWKDSGSAARFFYCAKANKKDRNEGLDEFPLIKGGSMSGIETRPDRPTNHPIRANYHPTVKPTDLMRYLCRLVTPPNGTILDPFTGSGSTGKAATLEGFNFIGIEQLAEYVEIATARIKHAKENQ